MKIENKYSRGVSIVEALIAAVIVAVGFISVYTMATRATGNIYSAGLRDNDTLTTAIIFDDLSVDPFTKEDPTYHEAISATDYNNLDLTAACNSSANVPVKKKERQFKRWCNTMNSTKGGMGQASSGSLGTDERKMVVREVTITANGYQQKYKIIGLNIKHYSKNRNQKKYYRKVIHE
jgi:Tfp pilus assembly protein PilV